MKKKVAFVNIFHGVGGGGEVYLSRLISNLSASIDADSFLISPSCKVLDNISIKKECIHGVSMSFSVRTIYQMLISVIEINRILRSERPDLVIINGDRAILLTPFLFTHSKKIGIKHMLIFSRIKYLVNLLPFRCLDRVVTISNFHLKNYLSFGCEKYFADKLTMIYNAVDVNFFDVKMRKDNHGVISFVEVASLDKRKGQLDLLIAFEVLKKKYQNINLHFIGVGESDKEYREFVKKHGLCDCVSFHGFQTDVRPFLSFETSVFVLPSYDEGLPIVLLEAMSCGLPVISTSIAGIPEIIEQGVNGFMFVPGDIKQLKLYMESFIEMPELISEMGIRARCKIVDVFNEEKWNEQWLQVL